MKTFAEFVDKKSRQRKRHLKVVAKIAENNGFNIKEHLDEEDPYIFILNNSEKLSFDGVRAYAIGDTLAYRVQKEEKTHPYGRAYQLDLESAYNDLLSDNHAADKAAQEIIKGVGEELKKFFYKSSEAEEELQSREIEKSDALGKITIKSTGTDYSNTVTGKGTNYGGAAG